MELQAPWSTLAIVFQRSTSKLLPNLETSLHMKAGASVSEFIAKYVRFTCGLKSQSNSHKFWADQTQITEHTMSIILGQGVIYLQKSIPTITQSLHSSCEQALCQDGIIIYTFSYETISIGPSSHLLLPKSLSELLIKVYSRVNSKNLLQPQVQSTRHEVSRIKSKSQWLSQMSMDPISTDFRSKVQIFNS